MKATVNKNPQANHEEKQNLMLKLQSRAPCKVALVKWIRRKCPLQ